MNSIAKLTLNDIYEGQKSFFQINITSQLLDDFARLSGDINPLHMDAAFASTRGFRDRVVHGALLCGFISKLVGIYLPGENCLLHSINVKFLMPTYVNDTVEVMGVVEQVSLGASIFVLSITIKNLSSSATVARGKVTVGFTSTYDVVI